MFSKSGSYVLSLAAGLMILGSGCGEADVADEGQREPASVSLGKADSSDADFCSRFTHSDTCRQTANRCKWISNTLHRPDVIYPGSHRPKGYCVPKHILPCSAYSIQAVCLLQTNCDWTREGNSGPYSCTDKQTEPEPEPECEVNADCPEAVAPNGQGFVHALCENGKCIWPELTFNCDSKQITCETFAPVEPCAEGQVHSVVNNCYGACVPITSCKCTTGGDSTECPLDGFTCDGIHHKCIPYTL